MSKTLRGRLQKLKNKGKVQWGNSKSSRGRLRELFTTKFKSQFNRGFTKVFVTRAGRLREWSQGELRLNLSTSFPVITATTDNNVLPQNYSI